MDVQEQIHIVDSAEARVLNRELAAAILRLGAEDYAQRSHFFHGRYENLYIDADRLPGLETILAMALSHAADLLDQPVNNLKLGFWLNIMHRGDVTTLHSHDDDDEVLSAVYYVQVPPGSGLFRAHRATEKKQLTPQAGRFMFFEPALPHEVDEHQSDVPRISIGINIGLAV